MLSRTKNFPWIVAVLVLLTAPAAAQKLPDGAWHRNRDRSYDLRHISADLTFDFDARRIAGTATLELVGLRPLDHVVLDAVGLDVESVTLGDPDPGGTSLEFETRPGVLDVVLPETTAEPLTLTVRYAATPRSGMYFQPDPVNPELTIVSTYGEGGIHANWLPIYADVNDKFTSEMRVTVPPPYVVISNGTLVEETEAAGSRTYHWRQERPHPNYLISLYVGDFQRGELEPAFGEIPLAYWVPRGRLEEGAWAFRNTTRMVEYFSELFDYRYPWVKYDQIAVPDYSVGAMEHTGVTGHNASVLRRAGEAPLDFGGPVFDEYTTDWSAEATISHELAHHWFGNNLTCRNLSFIWLNESFASYLMMLWDEESVGREQLLFDVELARRHYLDYVAREHVIRPLEYPYFDSPNEIYNVEHTYLKGAAVLHMLRRVLGDEAFFRALGDYLDRHEFGNVISRDLKIAIEDSVGKNLDWFFDDWITGAGHPVFEVSYRYLADRKLVVLEVDQVQPFVEGQGLFELPVRITLATAETTWEETVFLAEESETMLIPSPEEPLMVSFDGEGDLVAEVRFEKDRGDLAWEARHGGLVARLRALEQLAHRFPSSRETREVLAEILAGEDFWALRAEAAQLLGEIRTGEAAELLETALASSDYRVRKAAVLALARFPASHSARLLRGIVGGDASSDVVGTALVALAEVDPDADAEIFLEALGRDAWWDEIRVAALRALARLGRPEHAARIRPFVDAPYNQDVRQAALGAWEAAAPEDPALAKKLIEMAGEPPYVVQQYAIEALGRLAVDEARGLLERIVEDDFDPNLTQLAVDALGDLTPTPEAP